MILAPRTCHRHQDGEAEPPIPLAQTRSARAHVLLGARGMGKSRVLEQEAEVSSGRLFSAGDFITLNYPELQGAGAPVFIDNLDETRAGTCDGRVPRTRFAPSSSIRGARPFASPAAGRLGRRARPGQVAGF